MWLNLAAAKLPPGETRAQVVEARERVAGRLTRDELLEAQKLAREWMTTQGG